MAKSTEKPDASDEFWRDDAVAIAERERVDSTGFRMPAASHSAADPEAISPGLTQRQLAFALCLGVSITVDDTAATISQRIDTAKAKASTAGVNRAQQCLAELFGVDLQDCDSRSDAAWLIWEAYEESPKDFFDQLPESFQAEFCDGSLTRFRATHKATPAAQSPARKVGSEGPLRQLQSVNRCSTCGSEISDWAVLCASCGTSPANVSWGVIVVCSTIAGLAWFVMDLMFRN